MRPPAFWSKAPSHPAARLLAPLGLAYGALTARRMDRPGEKALCPVICIGNFTLGGAGKTPTAIAVARILSEMGARPAFLSRGYGGRLPGPVLVEPDHHRATEVGDEPILLARDATTVVARARPAGARFCVEQGADVIVMDDGLQNPSLVKNLSLAVVDAGVGVGNGLTCPAGPLRVPLTRQWQHVGGVVLIDDAPAGDALAKAAARRGLPVHRAWLVPEAAARRGLPVHRAWLVPEAAEELSGLAVCAFAGIGRPEKFFGSLRTAGARIVAERSFPDHHPYHEAELSDLVATAERLDAELVTTEKDHVRLPPAFAARVRMLRVRLRFADDALLRTQLAALVDGSRRSERPDQPVA